MSKLHHFKTLLIGIILLMMVKPVSSQDTVVIYTDKEEAFQQERFSGEIGVFIADMKSDLSLSSKKVGVGLTINIENVLGLQTSNTVFRADFKYVFSDNYKHSVLLGYFGFLRKSTKVFHHEIEFGDNTYPIGTHVSSIFDMKILKLIYGYSFFKDRRIDLGISAGFYIMPVYFELNAFGFKAQTADFVAPLPLLGLYSTFSITPKFRLTQSLELLYFNAFDMKGGITNLDISLEYKPLKHIGFGIALNSFQIDFTVYDKKNTFFDFQGTLRTGFIGVELFGFVKF